MLDTDDMDDKDWDWGKEHFKIKKMQRLFRLFVCLILEY